MIKKEMRFYSFIEFCKEKERYKELYDELSVDEKYEYKMYVYSLCFETEDIKDLMWEYLNGWEESIFELMKKYRTKLQKINRRKKYYDEICS
jgi:hypothetical protein